AAGRAARPDARARARALRQRRRLRELPGRSAREPAVGRGPAGGRAHDRADRSAAGPRGPAGRRARLRARLRSAPRRPGDGGAALPPRRRDGRGGRRRAGGLTVSTTRKLGSIGLLTAEERRRILFDWNATARPFADDEPVQRAFERWAAARPDLPAVRAGARQLT